MSTGSSRRSAGLSTSFSQSGPPPTPRTPHSRAGRAEEGFTVLELDTFGDDEYRDYAQQQRAPLLQSATDATFPSGYRAAGDDEPDAAPGALSCVWGVTLAARRNMGLVVGCTVAAFLLLVIYLALRQPDTLAEYVGDTLASATPDANDLSVIPVGMDPADVISYANYTRFPLEPMQYKSECHKLTHDFEPQGGYWEGKQDVLHRVDAKTCSGTITYMLDGHVGLLADLGLIAQAAGLAREFNKTFFIDDTYWNRGKWTDYFRDLHHVDAGPEPGCLPPPPEELVACPRTAKHWLINSRTAVYHFGASYHDTFDDPYVQGLTRFKPLYARAQSSFSHTIVPNHATTELIRYARSELASMLPDSSVREDAYVAAHIRQGDRKGVSWAFHNAPVPVSEYATALLPLLNTTPFVYAASDDPSALDDLHSLLPDTAQFLTLPDSAVLKLNAIASDEAYVQVAFNKLGDEDRATLTKGVIVDFAMVSGMWRAKDDVAPRATVCGFASNICKLAAVGLGWERAFGDMGRQGMVDRATAGWIDVDLKGAVVPEWEAYEMFN
ncbi:hypothetical protein K488DRAFT_43947 [Vararia minispora EC-137]|uniref:Uncharacterized protein n=1 Tax=Vararia minispora EC-137 TaxID=1314806 RepID=A0ACB8QTI7_9AGAM|nr:hypothetical protein K488DRAFT_43947 [Vararia minispora EC-137]